MNSNYFGKAKTSQYNWHFTYFPLPNPAR